MGKAANKIENYLKERVELLGGQVRKYTSPARRGVFDRIILLPRFVCFVEIKAPGDKMSKLQELEKRTLDKYGVPNIVIESRQQVHEFIMKYVTAVELNSKRRTTDAQGNELQG